MNIFRMLLCIFLITQLAENWNFLSFTFREKFSNLDWILNWTIVFIYIYVDLHLLIGDSSYFTSYLMTWKWKSVRKLIITVMTILCNLAFNLYNFWSTGKFWNFMSVIFKVASYLLSKTHIKNIFGKWPFLSWNFRRLEILLLFKTFNLTATN